MYNKSFIQLDSLTRPISKKELDSISKWLQLNGFHKIFTSNILDISFNTDSHVIVDPTDQLKILQNISMLTKDITWRWISLPENPLFYDITVTFCKDGNYKMQYLTIRIPECKDVLA